MLVEDVVASRPLEQIEGEIRVCTEPYTHVSVMYLSVSLSVYLISLSIYLAKHEFVLMSPALIQCLLDHSSFPLRLSVTSLPDSENPGCRHPSSACLFVPSQCTWIAVSELLTLFSTIHFNSSVPFHFPSTGHSSYPPKGKTFDPTQCKL